MGAPQLNMPPPREQSLQPMNNFMHIPADEWQSKMEASVKEVQKLEDHYTVKCQNLGVKHKAVSENCNKPGEAICKYAKEHNVDMILMGTRGLGTLRRTVLGSVSDYVLHHSECPVSIIPSNK
ncbi:Universal stress [Paramuricea clavata]|uniref:Universal stress n=1 Tax=Paramuricea clavata TaxID=317549 RepID=A0A7D9J662_PARCT|nr:Universal stress [Paramuricea clavata]